MPAPIRIANCSGFYGDRISAAREMVDGGPIDVLSGDWLAELTMLILAKGRQRDHSAGWARTFLTQMEQVMGDCLDRGIKVVSNAGGLAPANCAAAVETLADRLGLHPVVAYVEGDNITDRVDELRAAGVPLAHAETGAPLGDRSVVTANAYLGGWGIAEALGRGADIVVTGRVTDAALVVGPAAWHHRWSRDQWDQLAGAVVAGHVIECGAQTTGGNYSFFREVPGLDHPGFPIAEVAEDGSSVITKHPGTGGLVSVGTVTAQLLYEIADPRYINPDVTARFDSIHLHQEGPDRVRISGVRGESAPPTTKVALNYEGGFRTTSVLYLTGLDIEAKAALAEEAIWREVDRSSFAAVDVQLIGHDQVDPADNLAATAELRITVKDPDERRVGRAFSAKVTELLLANYPGIFASPPDDAHAYGVYWPALIPADLVAQEVVVGGTRTVVDPTPPADPPVVPAVGGAGPSGTWSSEVVRRPLGAVIGARSGDKGGNANLGVWARTDPAYAWMAAELTAARLQELLPETASLEVRRFDLPNLRALNFVIVGLLGEGVASTARLDGQAKGLGEYLRAKVVDIPVDLLSADS